MDLRWNCVGVAAIVASFAAIAPGCGKDEPASPQPGQSASAGGSAPSASAPAATAAPAAASAQQAPAPGAGASSKPAAGAGQPGAAAGGAPSSGTATAAKPASQAPAAGDSGGAAAAAPKSGGASTTATQDAPAAPAAAGGDDIGGTDSKDPEVRRLAALARDGRFAPYRALAKERVAAQYRLSSFQPDTSSDAALEASKKEYERLKADLAKKSEAMDSFLMSKKWTDEDYAVMGFIMSQVEAARFPG